MSQESLTGSCLCGGVRFEVRPPLAGFRYCHCSRCRKATGSAHAANIFLPAGQFKWLAGEQQIKHFDLPGAKRFAVSFCSQCGTRVPHKIKGTENMLVPAGILDAAPEDRPSGSIYWASRAAWYVGPDTHPRHDEMPT